jgi:hypothetical protein
LIFKTNWIESLWTQDNLARDQQKIARRFRKTLAKKRGQDGRTH